MLGRSALVALAMMGAVSGGAGRAMEITPTYRQPRFSALAGGPMLYAPPRGKGATMAQQKRASRKAKNIRRHKARARN